MLFLLEETTLKRASNVCRNQMMMVAAKITVNARTRKSFRFIPHQEQHAFGARHAVIRQLHHKRHRIPVENGSFHQHGADDAHQDAEHIQHDHHKRRAFSGKTPP